MYAGKAAMRYAKALHEAALAAGCVREALGDFDAIRALCVASPELRAFLHDYMAPRSRRMAALEELFRARLHPFSWRFMQFLESRKRCGLLPGIADALDALQRRAEGIVEASLTNAFPTDNALVMTISSAIGRRTSSKVRITTGVNPELIGGFTLVVGDILYDMSLGGALRRLERNVGATRGERIT